MALVGFACSFLSFSSFPAISFSPRPKTARALLWFLSPTREKKEEERPDGSVGVSSRENCTEKHTGGREVVQHASFHFLVPPVCHFRGCPIVLCINTTVQ